MNITAEQLRLCAVTDRSWLNGRTLADTVDELIRAGVTCVQLRERDTPHDEALALAQAVKAVCAKYGVPFLIYDNIALAQEVDADGVHVRLENTSVKEARRRLGPDKIIGARSHNVSEAVLAEREGADYVDGGAVFDPASRMDANAMPRDELWRICRAVSIPVVAFGGVTTVNAPSLKGCHIAGIASISALFSAEDKTATARALRTVAEDISIRPEPAPYPNIYHRKENA